MGAKWKKCESGPTGGFERESGAMSNKVIGNGEPGNGGKPEATVKRSVGKPENLRPLFEPFGLAPRDDETWAELSQILPAIAANYRARHEPAPDFAKTVENLRKFRDGLAKAVAALRDLSGPGRDFVAGEESGGGIHESAGPSGHGPRYLRRENWDLFERAFKSQNSVARIPKSISEENAAARKRDPAFWAVFDDQRDAASAFANEKAKGEVSPATQRRRRAFWLLQQSVEEAPISHDSIEDKLEELSALHGVSELAFDEFEKSWAGSGAGGQKGKFKPEMPGHWLVRKLVEVIDEFWGVAGLERVSAAREGREGTYAGKFYELLVGFHEYAKGADGLSLVEALKVVNETVYLRVTHSPRYLPSDPQAAQLAHTLRRALGDRLTWEG
jgi:hypothetical protein